MTVGHYKPFMAYLTPKEIIRLKKFSKTNKLPMAQVVREGISARMVTGNPYIAGFNDGLKKSVKVVGSIQASQMRFPSGTSFAELVQEEVFKHIMPEETENESNGTA
jgi:hypothetical protein